MNFNFGDPINIKKYFIILFIISIIPLLTRCSRIPEDYLWRLFDEIQRNYFPNSSSNDFIIKDPSKLKKRIEADVTGAINNYKIQTNYQDSPRISPPRYIEYSPDGSRAQSLLGGEMRLCAPWVPDCPPENTVFP